MIAGATRESPAYIILINGEAGQSLRSTSDFFCRGPSQEERFWFHYAGDAPQAGVEHSKPISSTKHFASKRLHLSLPGKHPRPQDPVRALFAVMVMKFFCLPSYSW